MILEIFFRGIVQNLIEFHLEKRYPCVGREGEGKDNIIHLQAFAPLSEDATDLLTDLDEVRGEGKGEREKKRGESGERWNYFRECSKLYPFSFSPLFFSLFPRSSMTLTNPLLLFLPNSENFSASTKMLLSLSSPLPSLMAFAFFFLLFV